MSSSACAIRTATRSASRAPGAEAGEPRRRGSGRGALSRSRACGLALLVVVVAAAAVASAAGADDRQRAGRRSGLRVHGSAVLDKAPDQLELVFAVVTQEESAEASVASNAAVMQRVRKALIGAGIAEDALATLDFRVDPVYGRRPQGVDPDWVPSVQAYRVSNRVRVRTARLDRAGELVDVATRAGANSVDSLHFGLADPRAHREEAIRAAAANAAADAKTLADAAGLELGSIRKIVLDPGAPRAEPYRMRAGFAQAESTLITPGEVQVEASVRVVYEITPRK